MNAIEQAVTIALIHFVWQGAGIAAALWAALLLLRNRSANSRYIAATIGLAALAAAPLITAWRVWSRPTTAYSAAITELPIRIQSFAAGGHGHVLSYRVLQAWALGVLLFSLRLVRSSVEVYRLRHTGEPAESVVIRAAANLAERMGLKRAARVLVSPLAEVPSVVGWLRPVILLPLASVTGLSPDQLETVLAYEIAHIRRYDYLVNLLQTVVETLLFYHPAVWWTSARIRHERELCCDDMVVRSCGDALCYARALTRLERLRGVPRTLALASTDGPLSKRIRRLLGEAPTERFGPTRLFGILALSLATVCVVLSLGWTRARAQDLPATPGLDGLTTISGAKPIRQSPDTPGDRAIQYRGIRYSPDMLSDQVRDSVSAEITIDEKGSVSDAHILDGPAQLRKPVLMAVLGWRFGPADAGTTRVVTITFPTAPVAAVARKQEQQVVLTFVRDELAEAGQQVASAPTTEAARRAQARLSELREKLDLAQASDLLTTNHPTLARIEIDGVSDASEIQNSLPIKEGDALTPETYSEITRFVSSRIAGPVEVSLTSPDNGKTAVLHIRRVQ